MKHRCFLIMLGFTLFMSSISLSAFTQVKFIEVNINQSGLAECQATAIQETRTTTLDVKIYPNPSDGDFTVELSNKRIMENVTIQISDMNGIQLHSEKIEGESLHIKKQMHLSHLAKGIYFLAVRFDQNQCVRRLIIL